jgi:3D (Asp-Asp-Asp) domain-containing protein
MKYPAIFASLFTLFFLAYIKNAQAKVRSESYVIEMRVLRTAYCLRGTTAAGTRAGPHTIAVDPRVIRLGTRLYVSGYGWGKALDTGSAIRGHHVDVWVSSCSQARRMTRYNTPIKIYR